MSETFAKCACRVCGGHIEFPSYAVGMSIGCPHCGATTDLYAEPPMPAGLAHSAAPSPAPPPIPQAPRLQFQGANRPAGQGTSVSGAPRLQVAAPPPPSAIPDYPDNAQEAGRAAPLAREP